MAHAAFPPSSADRWMACPASFALSLPLPDPPSSDYAFEGTRLHDIAANVLCAVPPVAPANPEDLEFLRPYLEHCQVLMRRTMTEGWMAETKVHHSALLSGTADFMAWGDGTFDVVDLKTGQGIEVDPAENKQLMTYAGMAAAKMPGVWKDIKRVRLTIVQPPAQVPVKTWETTTQRIEQHMGEVEVAISRSLEPAQVPVPGEHCRWCKAKTVCPKLSGAVDALPVSMAVAELSPEKTADILDRADLVMQFIDAVRAHGHDLAQRGVAVPGWTLKPKRATRQWADEEKVLEIARRRKIKIWQDKLMSPAMAEKAHPNLPAELREQIVAVSSGTNLVRGSSAARESIAPSGPSLEGALKNLIYRI